MFSEPPPPYEQPRPAGWRRSLLTFGGLATHPRQTMLAAALEGKFWAPILLVALAMAAFRLTMAPEIRAEYAKPESRAHYQTQRNITAEAADRELQVITTALPAILGLEALLMVLTGVTAVAILLKLIARFKFKSPVPFRRMFTMVAWGSAIGAIPILLNLALKLINPDLTLPTSPAAFLPDKMAGGYFYNVLLSLDVFMIIQVWLLSLGMSGLCKVSLQKSAGAVGTLFVIFIVLNAVLTSSANS